MILNKFILLIFLAFCFSNGNAQMKRFDNYVGVSGGMEIDNKVSVFALNYEYELFDVGPGLAAIGGSMQYRNRGLSISGNSIILGELIYNFSKISNGKFAPFLSFAGGSNFNFKDSYFIGHTGIRYFIDKNNSFAVKYGISKRSNATLELCFDVKL